MPLIEKTAALAPESVMGLMQDISFKVIADHARAITLPLLLGLAGVKAVATLFVG